MIERHVDAPWWRIVIAVLALLLLPIVVLAAIVATGFGLFACAVWFFGVGGSEVWVSGLIVLLFGALLWRIVVWARAGRKLMVRRARATVGGCMVVAAPLIHWALVTPPTPVLAQANWVVVWMYPLFGVWLMLDALGDRHGI